MNTHIIGVKGESFAVKYLKEQKYKILQRNFSCSFGEIDIVAKDGDYIVFVEVKSRSGNCFGMPREAVTISKQKTIIRCASLWLSKNNCTGMSVRFDVAEVYPEQIVLLKDAFRP